MRRFIILCVFALVVTVNGDCNSDCSEKCKSAIVPNSWDNCTMLLGFGPDDAGWFQTESGAGTCEESCDKTCGLICNNAGMPENNNLPQSRISITAALIGAGATLTLAGATITGAVIAGAAAIGSANII